MQTRHEYAADNSQTILTDNNNEFWCMDDKGNGDGMGITLLDDAYEARFVNADGETIGTKFGYGHTMDDALAALLA